MEIMQFEVTDKKAQEIESLIKDCGFEDRKAFFNNAITLLKWAVQHAQKGDQIASISKAGPGWPDQEKYQELSMPFLDHIQKNKSETN